MAASSLSKLRIYLHLVPVLGVLPSLWTIYGQPPDQTVDSIREIEDEQLKAASQLSVLLGIGCVSAIALLAAGSATQASQLASLRLLITSSFVGSGYFLLNIGLMFRVAKGQSIRIPGISQLSRRLR